MGEHGVQVMAELTAEQREAIAKDVQTTDRRILKDPFFHPWRRMPFGWMWRPICAWEDGKLAIEISQYMIVDPPPK